MKLCHCSIPNNKNEYIETKKFKTKIIDKECIICLEPLTKNQNVSIILKCDHYYHSKCLSLWFTKKETCPLCNTNLDILLLAMVSHFITLS